jgi:hypothetical protein
MEPYYFWPIFGTLFTFALLGLALLRNHLAASRRLQLRAIQKEERMAAIEAGLPLPEVEESMRGMGVTGGGGNFQEQVRWLRFVALGLGYLMLFSGLGLFVGFEIIRDEGLRQMSAIGFIPALAGVGLLLFYWVTRKQG